MAEATTVSVPISGTDKTLTFETGKLAPQSQGAVTARIGDTIVLVTQVGLEPGTPSDELLQAALGVMIATVDLEVLGEVTDAIREERDLHLGRARVGLVAPMLGNN